MITNSCAGQADVCVHVPGYVVTTNDVQVRVAEDCEAPPKSALAMDEFSSRFPTGREPEWDVFVIRHSAMQRAEIDRALRAARPLLVSERREACRRAFEKQRGAA